MLVPLPLALTMRVRVPLAASANSFTASSAAVEVKETFGNPVSACADEPGTVSMRKPNVAPGDVL